MLAYVFWHWRHPAVDPHEYEARQRVFHDALSLAPPDGFVRSASAALSGAPWAADGGEAYEDWYLVRNSSALDALNEAAVTASRAAPHDAAAALASGGTAGLYRLRLGAPSSPTRLAWWFGKPTGMRYEELWTLLAPVVKATPGAALWCRQMVLGPTPELCLQAPAEMTLPAPLHARAIALRPVWPVLDAPQRVAAAPVPASR